MKNLTANAIRVVNNQISILNQQKLPAVEWLSCNSPKEMHDMIFTLKIRGAPLIGIAASLALAQYAESGANVENIVKAAHLLKSSRPTAVNLAHCLDQQLNFFLHTKNPEDIVRIAEELFEEDCNLCEKIATHGQTMIEKGDHILTHCNTGGLVTTGIGTALGVIFKAHEQTKNIHVYVDETRPLLQGGRITAWELAQAHIPHTLICDNMAGTLMKSGKIQKIIVGADRIARNGDFANKIGTYSLAVLANFHNIPFYVAAPYTTIDLSCTSGDEIMIEERHPDEVRGASGNFGHVIWSEPNTPVFNPAFDVTPASLVSAFILDRGVILPKDLVL